MIFVDTSGWYTMFDRKSQPTSIVSRFLRENRTSLVTSDYVLDETLTLLRSRGMGDIALAAGARLADQELARVVPVTRDDFLAAWQVFMRYADKQWSFTHCTSKVIMERLGIVTAFTFDHHFQQFGNVTVVP